MVYSKYYLDIFPLHMLPSPHELAQVSALQKSGKLWGDSTEQIELDFEVETRQCFLIKKI